MKRFIPLILLLIPVLHAHGFAIPEATLTRTHLLKDIEESTTTLGFGVEVFRGDQSYVGELYYAYLGYGQFDWLEYGITLHSVYAVPAPFAEMKMDLVDIFTDSSRLSCLVMGGIGGAAEDQRLYIFYQGGLAANFRLDSGAELYMGAGSDSISGALSLQAGTFIPLWDWLGVSMNLKLVTGSEGLEPMISIAPLASIPRKQPGKSPSEE